MNRGRRHTIATVLSTVDIYRGELKGRGVSRQTIKNQYSYMPRHLKDCSLVFRVEDPAWYHWNHIGQEVDKL